MLDRTFLALVVRIEYSACKLFFELVAALEYSGRLYLGKNTRQYPATSDLAVQMFTVSYQFSPMLLLLPTEVAALCARN